MEDHQAYLKAKKRVEAKIGFYIHLTVYIAVNILLIVINLIITPQIIWFIWTLVGWGIGVLSHALVVFVLLGRSSSKIQKSIKDQMIEKEMEKDALKNQ